jgi:prepilin-type N-terminal cleavage/methylation domain-containing protein
LIQYNNYKFSRGFTIVELLVVIVVIGVIASVALVSYSGVSQKATEVALQSDTRNAARQIQLFQVENGLYPETIDCEQPVSSTNICIDFSGDTSIQSYTYDNVSYPQTYNLELSNDEIAYAVDEGDQIIITEYSPDLSASVGGGNPILSIQNYSSYKAPTNEGIIREWNSGANVYTANDLNAYTSTNGARNDYRDFAFPCPGNTVYNVHAAIEASASAPGGSVTISLSNDGGNTFISSNTTGTLGTNDTSYHFNTWPGWNYGYSYCTSGNFVIRLTANTDNNGIRVDNLLFWYNTGVSMGGGGDIP